MRRLCEDFPDSSAINDHNMRGIPENNSLPLHEVPSPPTLSLCSKNHTHLPRDPTQRTLMNLRGATERQIFKKDTQNSGAFRVTTDDMNDRK